MKIKVLTLSLLAMAAGLSFTSCTKEDEQVDVATLSVAPACSTTADAYAEKVRAFYQSKCSGVSVTMTKESPESNKYSYNTYKLRFSIEGDKSNITNGISSANSAIKSSTLLTTDMTDDIWAASFMYGTTYPWEKTKNLSASTWKLENTKFEGYPDDGTHNMTIKVTADSETSTTDKVEVTFDSKSFTVSSVKYSTGSSDSGVTYSLKAQDDSNSVEFDITKTLTGMSCQIHSLSIGDIGYLGTDVIKGITTTPVAMTQVK